MTESQARNQTVEATETLLEQARTEAQLRVRRTCMSRRAHRIPARD